MTKVRPNSDFMGSLNRIVAFEREVFGDDYVYYVEQMVRWHRAGNFFYVHVEHPGWGNSPDLTQAQSILGGMSAVAIEPRSLEGLIAGQIRAGQIEDWQKGDRRPVLYLCTLLSLKNRFIYPMFKQLLRELKSFLRTNQTAFSQVSVIAVNPLIERHLLRMGFSKVGSYRHRYAIMAAKPEQIGWLARINANN